MSDDPLGDYPRRGRPRVPPELRRRAKLTVYLTGDELAELIGTAASERDHKDRPLKVQDWARRVLLAAARKERP